MSGFYPNPALQKACKAFATPADFHINHSRQTNLDRTEQNSKDVRFQAPHSPLLNSQFQAKPIELPFFGLNDIENSYEDQETSSTQATMLPELSMLRERTLSSLTWRQARKIGYPWESPHLVPPPTILSRRIPNHGPPNLILRPQKSDENPPPIRLPPPVKNRLHPPPRLPDHDDFSLDDLSWNYGQTPQPNSAPEQLNYDDSPLRVGQEPEEQILYFESQGLEDEEDMHHLKGDCQDFRQSLNGSMLHHNSNCSTSTSSSPSPNSILGFMERTLHQNIFESDVETDCA